MKIITITHIRKLSTQFAYLLVLVVVAHAWCSGQTRAADSVPHATGFGSIQGVVTYQGKIPKSKKPDNAGHLRDLISVDRKSRGLHNALVYLELTEADVSKGKNARSGNDKKQGDEKNQGDPVVMDQLEHTFVPHLLAIRNGQRVKFTNSDTANHNVRAISFESKNQFNIFTGAGRDYTHQFVAGKKLRPTLLSCDIHPWMKAWIFVFDHSYFAVSDKKGKFKIKDIPPGKHKLTIYQPDIAHRKSQEIEVKAGETISIELIVKSRE